MLAFSSHTLTTYSIKPGAGTSKLALSWSLLYRPLSAFWCGLDGLVNRLFTQAADQTYVEHLLRRYREMTEVLARGNKAAAHGKGQLASEFAVAGIGTIKT